MSFYIEVTPAVTVIMAFGVGAIFFIIYSCVELLLSYLSWRRTHG